MLITVPHTCNGQGGILGLITSESSRVNMFQIQRETLPYKYEVKPGSGGTRF